MRAIGIDPGQNGGLAYLSPTKVVAVPMPKLSQEGAKDAGTPIDWAEVHRLLTSWKAWTCNAVTVEKSHAMPAQGVSSVFKFGSNYGGLLACLGAIHTDYRLVVPRTWKKVVLGEDYEHDKEGTISFVKHHHPSLNLLATARSKKAHDGMADAVAIAHYGINKSKDSVS